MPTPDETMEAYIELWNTADASERRSLADEVLVEDASITYPTVTARGPDGIVSAIGALHERFPGARFIPVSEIEQHHGWLREAWHLVDSGGTILSSGEDVAELADDGRFQRVIGFHNPLPPLA